MQELLEEYYKTFLEKNYTEDDKNNSKVVEKDSYEFVTGMNCMKDVEDIKYISLQIRFYFKEYMTHREASVQTRFFDQPVPEYIKTNDGEFLYNSISTEVEKYKIYLSIKPEKYVSAIKTIQEFIHEQNEKYGRENVGQCKFRKSCSNDAIVIRVPDDEQLEDVFNFIDKHPELKESFGKPNAFLPNKDGIMIIKDDGGSYNYFTSKVLFDYMFYCRDNNKNVDVNEFAKFVDEYESDDQHIVCNSSEVIKNFKDMLIGKITGEDDNVLFEKVISDEKGISRKREDK